MTERDTDDEDGWRDTRLQNSIFLVNLRIIKFDIAMVTVPTPFGRNAARTKFVQYFLAEIPGDIYNLSD